MIQSVKKLICFQNYCQSSQKINLLVMLWLKKFILIDELASIFVLVFTWLIHFITLPIASSANIQCLCCLIKFTCLQILINKISDTELDVALAKLIVTFGTILHQQAASIWQSSNTRLTFLNPLLILVFCSLSFLFFHLIGVFEYFMWHCGQCVIFKFYLVTQSGNTSVVFLHLHNFHLKCSVK